uniref:Zona pellucida sperm-binding protein 4 n=1 Tax=Terrapene triunguis TaxID=2587831 RepID=A0A674KAA9_9SAUR
YCGCWPQGVIMLLSDCRGSGGYWQDPSWLVCGQRSLQVTLLLNAQGKLHPLQNDSACETWVSHDPGGSVRVNASYTGCYVMDNYMMVVGSEGMDVTVQKTLREGKVLRSCLHPALDAPSPNLRSAVQSLDRLVCASPPINQGDCEGLGCCYNPSDRMNPYYYGNTVTVQCTPDGQFAIAVPRAVTLPSLILDLVRLANGRGAFGPESKLTLIGLVNLPVSDFSSQMAGDQGMYENELVADRDVRIWSRDSVSTLPPPPAVSQPGPLMLELRIATEQNYGSYYTDRDYPVVKVLQDPIYMEVRILQRTDPDLVLVLHHCWATPSANPQQQPQWPILGNFSQCPYAGDNYRTQLVPVGAASGLQLPSHHQRFISTFTFVESASQRALTGPVYLHCSASVCLPSRLESCTISCSAGASKCTSSRLAFSPITSRGPVFLLQDGVERNDAVQSFREYHGPDHS